MRNLSYSEVDPSVVIEKSEARIKSILAGREQEKLNYIEKKMKSHNRWVKRWRKILPFLKEITRDEMREIIIADGNFSDYYFIDFARENQEHACKRLIKLAKQAQKTNKSMFITVEDWYLM